MKTCLVIRSFHHHIWICVAIFLSTTFPRAQNVVSIGTGISATFNAPVYISSATSSNKYSQCAMIYTYGEIGTTGNITKIAWYKGNTNGYVPSDGSLSIYMKKTPSTSIATAGGTFAQEKQGATLVYSRSNQSLPQVSGWMELDLDIPYSFDGTGNLMILVDWFRPNNATGPVTWRFTNAPDQSITWSGVNANPGSFYNNGSRPNVQLTFYDPLDNDAGIQTISGPLSPLPPGTSSIVIGLRNYGTDTLFTSTLNWSVGGVHQTPYPWVGILPPAETDSFILIGSHHFSPGSYYIQVWSSFPNGVPDSNQSNDTLGVNVLCAQPLSGIYTIGGPLSDFPDMASALQLLQSSGVNGPVDLKIQPGTYEEQLSIGVIPGAGLNTRVTFQSASMNPADVTIQYNASDDNDNYVVKLDGTSFISIDNLTIKSLDSVYSRALVISGGSHYNLVTNNIIECRPEARTSFRSAGVYSPSSKDNHNIIAGNVIRNAYQGVYLFGPSNGDNEVGNIISYNNIENTYYQGIYCIYQKNLTIEKNRIRSYPTPVFSYSLTANACHENLLITGNHIEERGVGTSYGIRVVSSNATTGSNSLICNNYVLQSALSPTNAYGLMIETSTNQRVFHNTVILKGQIGNSRVAQFMSGSNNQSINNLFVHLGGGFALVVNNNPFALSNYNTYWTTGNVLALHQGVVQNTLAALQSTISQDYQSLFTDPGLIPPQLSIPSNPAIDNVGIALPDVPVDLDGMARNPLTPDPGAYEFSLFSHDAGIVHLDMPDSVTSPGQQNIAVGIRNFGTDTLFSLHIYTKLDSNNAILHSWNGILFPQEIISHIAAVNQNFNIGTSTLTAWTALPNNIADPNPWNDTLKAEIKVCNLMSGVYTIGDTALGFDFQSFGDAISALGQCGVAGPVTFSVEPGYYYEQVKIGSVFGSSASNLITFTSSTGISQDVIVAFQPTQTNKDWVFCFENAKNVRLHQLSLRIESGSVSGKCVRLNGSSSIEIANSTLILPGVNDPAFQGIFSNGSNDSLLFIQGNLIIGGYAGVTLHGSSSSQSQAGNIILDNRILDFSGWGISLRFQDAPGISGNLIQAHAVPGDCSGMDLYALNGNFRVEGNRILLSGNGKCTGILLRYSTGDSLSRALVYNNFITIEPTSNNNSWGLSMAVVGMTDIFHNSIHSATPRGAMHFGSLCQSIRIINNIFYNPGSGTAFFSTGLSSLFDGLDVMDFNCYYTHGPSLIFAGTDYASLSAWQSTGADTNSLSLNPHFISNVLLYPSNAGLDNAGAGLPEVPTDIDGRVRNTFSPDPGAVEFTSAYNDAGVFEIVNPENPDDPGFHPIIIKLTNAGLNPLTSCTIHYQIDSGALQSISWNGFLPSQSQSDTITIGNQFFPSGQHHLKIFTSNPNASVDEIPMNDTLERVFHFCTPYAGIYTIDTANASADFSSISEAISAMMRCGISDSVILEIAAGTYNEQIRIGSIPGAGLLKPLIFRSASQNPSDVVIQYKPADLATNYVICLDGASFISIQNVSIIADSSATYGRAVVFRNDAKHNSLMHNIIKAPSHNSQQFACIFSDGGSEDYTVIENNQIIGGGYGIYWLGQSNVIREIHCTIKDNYISQQAHTGIYTSFQTDIVIQHNQISHAGVAAECNGIYISKSSRPQIFANFVTLTGSNKNYPIKINECEASATHPGKIVNNIAVQTNQNADISNALWVRKTSHHCFAYNTLIVASPQSNGALSLLQLQDSNTFLNNQLIHKSSGYSSWIDNASSLGGVLRMDHNNFYTDGNKLGYLGSPVSSLAQWRVITGQDANSINHDPVFQSASSYIPTSAQTNNLGTPISGITEDIFGNVRNAVNPDIGAIEFDPLLEDAGLVSLKLLAGVCDLGNENLQATVVNYGYQTIASNSISLRLQKPGGQISPPEWIPDSIPALDSISYTFQYQIDLSTSNDTCFLIKGWLDYQADALPHNDTSELKVFSLNTPPIPQVSNVIALFGDSATLKVIDPEPGIDYRWYNANGISLFAIGDSVRILPSFNDTVFFVSAIARYEENFSAGPQDPSFATFSSGNDLGQYLEFEVIAQGGIYIDSVDIYPTTFTGSLYEIIVTDDNGLIFSKSGSTTVSPFSRERVALGCYLPEGQGYNIGFSANTGMVRNVDGAQYPYFIPHIIKITGNSGSPYHYPWFYNIQVRTQQLACESAQAADSVFVLLPPLAATAGFDSTICVTDTILIGGYAVGGIPPYQYDWTPTNGLMYPNSAITAAFPSDTTEYLLSITDLAGQVAFVMYTLNVAPLPSVSLSLPFDSLEVTQQPVILSGGSPAGGIYSGSGVSSGLFDPGTAGIGMHVIIYHYQDPANGCRNVALDTLWVGNLDALQEYDRLGFLLFPNPSVGHINLIMNENHHFHTLQIRNQYGQRFMEHAMQRISQIRLDISSLSPGIYYLSVLGEGRTLTRKFILLAP